RAKIIHAEGELQASEKLMQAAQMLSRQPQAMQLRYLQTLANIAGDKTSTIVFPLPIDILTGLTPATRAEERASPASAARSRRFGATARPALPPCSPTLGRNPHAQIYLL